MDRSLLIILLLIDAAVIAAASYVLYDRIQFTISKPKEVPKVEAPQQILPKTAPQEKQEVKRKFRNIGFTYFNSKATSVYVDGSWGKKIPMKKVSTNKWEAVVQLKPGEYYYYFEVDGKVVYDPFAKEVVKGLGCVLRVQEF